MRIMLSGIISSSTYLLQVIIILIIHLYMFSVSILMMLAARRAMDEATFEEDALEHFGSLYLTSYTLFMAVFGGIDWEEACDPLFKNSVLIGLLFLLFILTTTVCVLNVVTGVFV